MNQRATECITAIEGAAIPLPGDDIDTDRIIPARYLRCVSFAGLGEHVFEDDRRQAADHPFNQETWKDASILLAGDNFGCGSSREHAPQALKRWGIQAIVARSFAEIFAGNCTALGIPCLQAADDALDRLCAAVADNPALVLKLTIADGIVIWAGGQIQTQIPEGTRRAFIDGTWHATRVLQQAQDQVERTAAALPYINGFA